MIMMHKIMMSQIKVSQNYYNNSPNHDVLGNQNHDHVVADHHDHTYNNSNPDHDVSDRHADTYQYQSHDEDVSEHNFTYHHGQTYLYHYQDQTYLIMITLNSNPDHDVPGKQDQTDHYLNHDH